MRNFPNYLRFYKDEWHALEVPKVEFTRRKNAVEWEKWHFIAAAKLWLREREKKRKKREEEEEFHIRRRETGEDHLPICSIAQQRLAREGFEQICSIELQTCFTRQQIRDHYFLQTNKNSALPKN